MVEAEKQRLKSEFERRAKALEVEKKVAHSKAVNAARLKELQAREEAVRSLLQEAEMRLVQQAKDKSTYAKLLADLLAQALERLGEPQALVRFRKVDEPLAEGCIRDALAVYASRHGKEAPEVKLDTATFLPPPPANGKAAEGSSTCAGGVVVTSADGRIVCANTLDERLKITYSQNLPALRQVLFG